VQPYKRKSDLRSESWHFIDHMELDINMMADITVRLMGEWHVGAGDCWLVASVGEKPSATSVSTAIGFFKKLTP